MKRLFIKILFKLLLPDRMLEEANIRKRAVVMNRIRNDEEIINLLRSEYTREYKGVINSWFIGGKSKDFLEGFYAGRLFKLNELINDIIISENQLKEIERKEEKDKVFGILDKFKKKSNLVKDPF